MSDSDNSPMDELSRLRVAVVHDWLSTFAGSEQVLTQILDLFPQADLYSICDFLSDADRKRLGGKRARTTFIQRLPFAKKRFRHYLPLMPLAIEQFDLRGYDLILSSSHAVGKGVLTGPDQLHISYVNSPIRYAWDLQHEYLAQARMTRGLKSMITRCILHYIRQWDVATGLRPDVMIGNSNFICRRIQKFYRRPASTIYPCVDVDAFSQPDIVPRDSREDFYLAASRLVPYKRMDLIAEAFTQLPERKLVIIGDGSERKRLKEAAAGHPNIELMGYQPHSVLKDKLRHAKAFIFAAEEDFGIAPVEAIAAGTPVIAFGAGGSTETVLDGRSGIFFERQDAESLRSAVIRFEAGAVGWNAEEISQSAERFSTARFRAQYKQFVAEHWEKHRSARHLTGST
ncbi:MAG: glycosyltransferase [Pirellulales bacterium]